MMTDFFKLNPHLKTKKYNLEENTFYIIDDLYKNPETVREYAFGLNFKQPKEDYFPGLIAKNEKSMQSLYDFCSSELDIQVVPNSNNHSEFRIFNRPPEELDQTQVLPHIDTVLIDNATLVVVYLNVPDQCKGGTAFYKHKATGLNRLDSSPEVLEKIKAAGCDSLVSMHKKMVSERSEFPRKYIADSNEHWELTEKVEMRFNRAIVFNPNRFHSAYIKRGHFDFSGVLNKSTRLIHRTFFLRRTYST